MWLHKAQSTTEYAITIGLVMALVAGVLQIALKGGIRQKNQQAVNYMMNAGNTVGEFSAAANAANQAGVYSEETRTTQVLADGYQDKYLMEKGGGEKRLQAQVTTTESESKELIENANPGSN